jgi:hypothetical protein
LCPASLFYILPSLIEKMDVTDPSYLDKTDAKAKKAAQAKERSEAQKAATEKGLAALRARREKQKQIDDDIEGMQDKLQEVRRLQAIEKAKQEAKVEYMAELKRKEKIEVRPAPKEEEATPIPIVKASKKKPTVIYEESESESEPEVVIVRRKKTPAPVKPKAKKKTIVYEDSSSEESEEEVVVKRKSSKKAAPEPVAVAAPKPTPVVKSTGSKVLDRLLSGL